MTRFAIAVLLSAALLPTGTARAGPVASDFWDGLRLAGQSIVVPPEWDGIWTTEDSVYDCVTGFKTFDAGKDTLCSGQVYAQGGPLSLVCNGTADATTFHATCTGSEMVFPDCMLLVDIQIDATRTADSYRAVTVTNTSYSGTGTGCSLLPPTCTRSVTYGTRTSGAPADYCATPVKQTTWGRLKAAYR